MVEIRFLATLSWQDNAVFANKHGKKTPKLKTDENKSSDLTQENSQEELLLKQWLGLQLCKTAEKRIHLFKYWEHWDKITEDIKKKSFISRQKTIESEAGTLP